MNTTDHVIVPTSGGKDSALCLALAKKHYTNVISIFHDTGWEHPLTYEYLDYLSNRLDIEIHKTIGGKYGKTLEETIIYRRDFPNGAARFCTKQLKQIAFMEWYERTLYQPSIDARKRPTRYEVWFGIRTEESSKRKKKYGKFDRTEYYEPEIIFPRTYKKKVAETLLFRFPILDLHSSQVKLWLKKLDVKMNPLYDIGSERVGCYPCLLSSAKEQERCFSTDFGKIQLAKIRKLEDKIGVKHEMNAQNEGACRLCQM